jgi:hypothetical protein
VKQTRAQLLWTFQAYLDRLKIMDPERRERLSSLFLDRGLSRETEKEFSAWLKTNHLLPARPVVMRTRGSRLAYFRTWLDIFRPFADRDERERLTRLYNNKQLARDIEREFHQYVRNNVSDRRMLS